MGHVKFQIIGLFKTVDYSTQKRIIFKKLLLKQEEDYCKPIRVGNFRNNNYIEYESKGIEIKS